MRFCERKNAAYLAIREARKRGEKLDEIKKILLAQLQMCQKRTESRECFDSDAAALTKAMSDITMAYASLLLRDEVME